jgi:peptide/nickel transport system substrate-binding protein
MRSLWLCVVFLINFVVVPFSFAKTPIDSLVVAMELDEIMTLDPAEAFEVTSSDYIYNTYDQLLNVDSQNPLILKGQIAEKWDISPDGKTYTFHIKKGLKFASGNPITAQDVIFSLRRLISLNKSPAGYFNKFGWTPDTVQTMVRAEGEDKVILETDRVYAPNLLLYCLTTPAGSIVDHKVVASHEKNGDFGHEWLKTHGAESGPFVLKKWVPKEILILERNPFYREAFVNKVQKVIFRHIAKPENQQLLLQKGDIDVARNLTLPHAQSVKDAKIQKVLTADTVYMQMNQKNPYLSKPEVRQALRYLIDYQGLQDQIGRGEFLIHQSFLPKGFPYALEDQPYTLNVEKAKELLKQAGLEKGFTLTLDVFASRAEMAQALQSTFAKAGIELKILMGDQKQILTKIRERRHDLAISQWSPDYFDPHMNAETFARNPDNSDQASEKTVAWRSSWNIPELTKKAESAALETEPAKRQKIYEDLQRLLREDSPFINMFQKVRILTMRPNVDGLVVVMPLNRVLYKDVVKK